MNFYLQESTVAVVLIALLALLINPWWMPGMLLNSILVGILLLVAVFATFVWRERGADEREALHTHLAGRLAFLAGTIVLALGIITQEMQEQLDVWLVAALGAMVLAKAGGLVYARLRQ